MAACKRNTSLYLVSRVGARESRLSNPRSTPAPRLNQVVEVATFPNSYPCASPSASVSNRQAVVAELLGAGANVNLVNTLGTTPLHSACAHLQPHCVELLLARG